MKSAQEDRWAGDGRFDSARVALCRCHRNIEIHSVERRKVSSWLVVYCRRWRSQSSLCRSGPDSTGASTAMRCSRKASSEQPPQDGSRLAAAPGVRTRIQIPWPRRVRRCCTRPREGSSNTTERARTERKSGGRGFPSFTTCMDWVGHSRGSAPGIRPHKSGYWGMHTFIHSFIRSECNC